MCTSISLPLLHTIKHTRPPFPFSMHKPRTDEERLPPSVARGGERDGALQVPLAVIRAPLRQVRSPPVCHGLLRRGHGRLRVARRGRARGGSDPHWRVHACGDRAGHRRRQGWCAGRGQVGRRRHGHGGAAAGGRGGRDADDGRVHGGGAAGGGRHHVGRGHRRGAGRSGCGCGGRVLRRGPGGMGGLGRLCGHGGRGRLLLLAPLGPRVRHGCVRASLLFMICWEGKAGVGVPTRSIRFDRQPDTDHPIKPRCDQSIDLDRPSRAQVVCGLVCWGLPSSAQKHLHPPPMAK
jgi:hypothetical protein